MSVTLINKPSQKEISQRKLETFDKYSKVIQWGRAYPVEFTSRFMGIELLDMQKYAFYNSWSRDFVLWLESRNAGKALAFDTPLPSPNGFTTVGEIKVGDLLFDEYGNPTTVTFLSPIYFNHMCYDVVFEDNEHIVADHEHNWQIYILQNDTFSEEVCNTFKIKQYLNQGMEIAVPDFLHYSKKYKLIKSITQTKTVATRCLQVDNPRHLFLCGKHDTVTHNTTKLAVYTMTRSLLFPFHVTYFLGNTGDQAKEVYKKVEKIAKKEIESFAGCTDIFFNELKKNGATSDGFVHNPASFTCTLFNGAEINTLNSDITNIKGKRANLVCFDEAGWFSDELFVQAENFVNQDENFKLGGTVDILLEPKGLPRQLLYASSASDTSSEYYKKFRYFSERMLIGDQKYFVCNFNIDMVMKAKFNGEPYPALISQDKVDKAMGDNRDKALRELYNKFSADSHEGQILTRREIMQYTKLRPPLLLNDTGDRLFIMAWDSARLNDNSVIGIAELIDDPERGWCMDIQNVVSLVDITTKNKTPMILPDQVKKFQDLLIDYNGSDKCKLDYENIKAIICDSGSGGQMIGGVADYMLDNWVGKDGKQHKGIIDKSHKANETTARRFTEAVDIMKLVDPRAHRNEIFDAAEKMTKLGIVTFPADYDGKDYILSIDDDGNENKYDLSVSEKEALAQIELMKTEIITMCKYVSGGNIRYDYPPEKRNTMHDDRCFVYGLLCYYLAQLRRGQMIRKPRQNNFDPSKFVMSKQPTIRKI